MELKVGQRIRYQDRVAKVKKIVAGMVCLVYEDTPGSKSWCNLCDLKWAMNKGRLTVL